MMDLGDSSFETTSTPTPVDLPGRGSPALLHAGFAQDPDVGVAALGATRGARCFVTEALCGGEMALACAGAGAARVVFAPLLDADASAALLRFKIAAHAGLERADALRLLGLLRASRALRLALQQAIALPAADAPFWDRHADALAAGLYAVSAEVTLGRLLRNLLRAHLAPADYRTLMYGDRAARLAVFDARLGGSGFWRHALRLCALRGRLSDAGDEPVGSFTHRDPVETVRRLVEVGLPASPIWARAFCNDAGVSAVLPAHLRPEGHAILRAHARSIEVREAAPLAALCQERTGAFDAVDLGNVPDHLEPPARTMLLREAARVLRPGGRLVAVTLDPAALRAAVPSRLAPLEALDSELARRDRAPVRGRWCVFAAP
jgi:SAM-dependent methyltransferase